ncbi:hypothetical protein [Oricola sp.]|uniref:hypothetical protein n=1 Tax=Oricola sp. TaxID=1979950 RepID=UPI003BABA85C
MAEERDKLLIKIGQSFEANASGRLAVGTVILLFFLVSLLVVLGFGGAILG